MRPVRLIFCLSLVFAACHKHVPLTALPPAPAPTPARAPAPEPAPAPAPAPTPPPPAPPVSPLASPDRAFAAGSYDEAARGYDDYLHANAAGSLRDHALFYFGLSLVSRPAPDWSRATAEFKELVDQHPGSPYKQPATVILSLRSELDQSSADINQRDMRIKQLTTELDRLKKIDAARRK